MGKFTGTFLLTILMHFFACLQFSYIDKPVSVATIFIKNNKTPVIASTFNNPEIYMQAPAENIFNSKIYAE
jgi:hypothetical protein